MNFEKILIINYLMNRHYIIRKQEDYYSYSLLNNPTLTVIMITHHLRPSTENKLDGILNLT